MLVLLFLCWWCFDVGGVLIVGDGVIALVLALLICLYYCCWW